jgi:hypothetical protein
MKELMVLTLRHGSKKTYLISNGIQEEFNHLKVTLVACKIQGRLFELIQMGNYPCSMFKQDLQFNKNKASSPLGMQHFI